MFFLSNNLFSASKKSGWIVVKFLDNNTIETVPYKWAAKSKGTYFVYWPSFRSQIVLNETIKNQEEKQKNWLKCPVLLVSKNRYFSFEDATKIAEHYKAKLPKRRKLIHTDFRSENSDSSDNESYTPSLKKTATETTSANLIDLLPVEELTDLTPSTSSKEPNEDFQQLMIQQLHLINHRLQQQQQVLNVLKHSFDAKPLLESLTINSNEEDDEVFVSLPVSTDEQLLELEAKLSASQTIVHKVARKFALVGGDNVKELLKRVLPRIIGDELASTYSWVGGKGKKKFFLLKLTNVIKECVKCNSSTSNVTEKEIEEKVARWLTKAPYRVKSQRDKDSALNISNQ